MSTAPTVARCGRCGQPADPPVGYFLGDPICAACDEQQGWPAERVDTAVSARPAADPGADIAAIKARLATGHWGVATLGPDVARLLPYIAALETFRDAIDRASGYYQTGDYTDLDFDRSVRLSLKRCQDELDALDAAPARAVTVAEALAHGYPILDPLGNRLHYPGEAQYESWRALDAAPAPPDAARPPLPRLVTGSAPMDPRAAIAEVTTEDDLAREEARDRLFDATLAYGAAHEACRAERRRLHAANYQGDTAEGADYRALLIAEADAQDALHAAYVVWVGAQGAQTQEGE